MSRSLVAAINAIELADEDANVSGLRAYCEECGLNDEQVQALVDAPGPTDLGRVVTALRANAPVEQPEQEKDDSDTDETSDAADADDVSES